MLADVGQPVILCGPVTLNDVQTATTGITIQAFFQTSGKTIGSDGYLLVTSEPSILVSEADGAMIIRNATIITIDAVDYQAFNNLPDGAGFIQFDLTRDF